MILELVIGECACCGYTSILFNDLEAYICVDRDTCRKHEAPKEVQKVYIAKYGPVTPEYYLERVRRGKI